MTGKEFYDSHSRLGSKLTTTAVVTDGTVIDEFIWKQNGDYRSNGGPLGLIGLNVESLPSGFRRRTAENYIG